MLIATRGLSVAAVFLVFALLAIMPGIAAAADSVSRHLSSGSVMPGGQINVTLGVSLEPGCRFFVMDEVIPDGWSVIDSGSLVESGKINASESRHLKIVEFNGATDTSYTYQVRAPVSVGTYSFSGVFVVDDMGSYDPISGDKKINVGSSSGNNDGSASGSVGLGLDNSAQVCPDGIITSGCVCQGVFKDAGYCCDGYFQTAACGAGQGPLPVLEDCDEGESEQCGSNIGACSFGVRVCNSGIWSDCTGGAAPSAEYYDGIDNDCDGEIDEDCSAADISRCEANPSQCLCGASGKSEASFQGNLSLYFAPESVGWLVIVIAVIILAITTKKTIAYRHTQGHPLSLPPVPISHRLSNSNVSFLMALKGIVEDYD
jgi:hypothetical protein